jgi:hypothetical protein
MLGKTVVKVLVAFAELRQQQIAPDSFYNETSLSHSSQMT